MPYELNGGCDYWIATDSVPDDYYDVIFGDPDTDYSEEELKREGLMPVNIADKYGEYHG